MLETTPVPQIIQGGMGVAVSNWRLARAVACLGQLGVVSGTVIDTVLIRRLQDGDPGGHMRRAMAHFPIARAAEDALHRYWLPAGRPAGRAYRLLSLPRAKLSPARRELMMLAAFVEVWLACDLQSLRGNDKILHVLPRLYRHNLGQFCSRRRDA